MHAQPSQQPRSPVGLVPGGPARPASQDAAGDSRSEQLELASTNGHVAEDGHAGTVRRPPQAMARPLTAAGDEAAAAAGTACCHGDKATDKLTARPTEAVQNDGPRNGGPGDGQASEAGQSFQRSDQGQRRQRTFERSDATATPTSATTRTRTSATAGAGAGATGKSQSVAASAA